MKTNSSLLVLLCREDGERHRSQCPGESVWSAMKFYLLQVNAQKKLQLSLTTPLEQTYEVLSESSWAVIVVTALVKEDERGGQGCTSTSLLHQSTM
jgi:hypothetical protein